MGAQTGADTRLREAVLSSARIRRFYLTIGEDAVLFVSFCPKRCLLVHVHARRCGARSFVASFSCLTEITRA